MGERMSESPFGPAETIKKRELKFYEKFYQTITDRVNEFYLDSIPSDDVKAMPPKYKYIIGGFILIILAGVFTGVFLPGYLQTIDQKFLVPGQTSSKYCDEVSISNSGDYLATQDGYWIGGLNFEYSKAAYSFNVQNLDVDSTQFKAIMMQIYYILEENGAIFKTQDLGVNLLYWMTFTLVSSLSAAQRFYFTGNPLIVFNREFTVGSISSIDSDCDIAANSEFDQANGLMKFQYDYTEFTTNPTCNTTLSPSVFGYTTASNPDLLKLSIDIRSLITAFAVNYEIMDVSVLQEIAASRSEFLYEDNIYNASSFTNPNFPGMDPIYCINYEGTYTCVVATGSIFGLPYYNQMGSDPYFPFPCNCSALTAAQLSDKYDYCNLFNFISGVVVYDTFDTFPIFQLATRYNVIEFNVYAYYASFIGSTWGMNSPNYTTIFDTPETREDAYAFCYVEGYGYCSLVIFSSFDIYNTNWAISDYFFSVPNGACRDTVTTSLAYWDDLINTPYAPLTQSYSECRNSPSSVLLTQAGVAVGNVSIISPFGVLFVLILIGIYQNITGWAIPKTYSRAEKDSALDALALALLKARDEKRKQKINPDHRVMENLITKLVDDLSEIAEAGDEIYYKQDEIDRFEVDWSAVVSPFRTKSRTDSRVESNQFEMSNLEAPPEGSGKVVFQRKFNSSVQNRFPDLLILNTPSVYYKGKTSLTLSSHSHAGLAGDRLSSSNVRAQLTSLKKDIKVELLYTQTIEALDVLITSFKEQYRNKDSSGGKHSNGNTGKLVIAPEYVDLSDKTSVLNDIEALTKFQEIATLNEADIDEDDEEVDTDDSNTSTAQLNKLVVNIYKKIYTLMLLHAGIVLHCEDVVTIHSVYGDKVAYSVNNEVCTMQELKVKSNVP